MRANTAQQPSAATNPRSDKPALTHQTNTPGHRQKGEHMELNKNNDSRYERFASLLVSRDHYKTEARQTMIGYTAIFGDMTNSIMEKSLKCIETKKAITYCQALANKGEVVDVEQMQIYLMLEMKEFYDKLAKSVNFTMKAKAATEIPALRVSKTRTLYRRIVKMIHPDIIPHEGECEILAELWLSCVEAYQSFDVDALQDILVAAESMLAALGIRKSDIQIPDIDEKIAKLREEIASITHSNPYTLREYLEDDIAIENHMQDLRQKLQDATQYLKELQEVLATFIEEDEKPCLVS